MKYKPLIFTTLIYTPCMAFTDNISEVLPEIVVVEDVQEPAGTTLDKVNEFQPVQQLFSDMPGVDLVSRQPASIEDARIRGVGGAANDWGVGGGRVHIDIDGLPLPPNFNLGHQGTKGRSYFDSANLKTVEVSRGPSFSNNATGIGGAISFKTRDAQDILLDNRAIGAELSGGYDARYKELMQRISTAFETDNKVFSGLLAYTRRNSHEPQHTPKLPSNLITAPSVNAPYSNRGRDLFSKFSFQPTQGQQINLQAGRYHSQYDKEYTESATNFFNLGTFASQLKIENHNQNVRNNYRNYYALSGSHDIETWAADNIAWSLGTQQAQTQLRTRKIDTEYGRKIGQLKVTEPDWAKDIDWDKVYSTWSDDEIMALEEKLENETVRERPEDVPESRYQEKDFRRTKYSVGNWGATTFKFKGIYFNLNATKFFSTRSFDNQLHYGFSLSREDSQHFRTDGQVTKLFVPPIRQQKLTLFASNEFIFPNKDFTITPSIKWEHYTSKPQTETKAEDYFYSDRNGVDNNGKYGNIDNANSTHRYKAWNASLLMNWRINPVHALSLNLSQATRFPMSSETNVFNYFHAAIESNPNLRPEKARAITLTWSMTQDWLKQSLTLSHTNYLDMIYMNAGYEKDTMRLENRPFAKVQSIEYEGSMNFSWLNQNLSPLTLSTTLAWAKGWNPKDGTPLNTIDPFHGNVKLAWNGSQWTPFIRTNFALAKRDKDIADDAVYGGRPDPLPGYATLDVGVNYTPSKALNIALGVYNVFNKQYKNWADAALEKGTRDNLWQPGRGASLNFSYKF